MCVPHISCKSQLPQWSQAVDANIDKWTTDMARGWAGSGSGSPLAHSARASGLFARLYVALWALQLAANQLDGTVSVLQLPDKHKWGHLTRPLLDKASAGGRRRPRRALPVASVASEALGVMDRLLGTEEDLTAMHAGWQEDEIVWAATARGEADSEGGDVSEEAASPSDDGVAAEAGNAGNAVAQAGASAEELEDSDGETAPAADDAAGQRSQGRRRQSVLDD